MEKTMTTDANQQESSMEEEILSHMDDSFEDDGPIETPEPVEAVEEIAEPEQAVDEVVDEVLEPLLPPTKWDKNLKEIFNKWGELPEGRSWQEQMYEQFKKTQGHVTQVEQERAQFAQQAQQWNQVIEPYQDMIARTGATPDQLVRQSLALAHNLSQDPRATLLRLAQSAGIDLNQLTQDQPYVDPQVNELTQRLRRMEQEQIEREKSQRETFTRRQQAENDQQIQAFAEAKDESGKPLHPHLDAVQDKMAEYISGRAWRRQQGENLPAMTLDEAYELACKNSPEISQAEEATKKAAEAAKRAAAAKKSQEAARRVEGKTTGADPTGESDIKAEIAKNWEKYNSQAA